MKLVILAGGMGTRISEESHLRPKPMIEIGGRPILWHIMRTYAAHGISEFVVCLGYKGHMVKEYFANYALHSSDVTFWLNSNAVEFHERHAEPWKVTLVDTGQETNTGGRLKRVAKYLDGDFCLTYGDGLADIDISALISFHRKAGTVATVTAVQTPGRFGSLSLTGDKVSYFVEKPLVEDRGWINGGYFVMSEKVLDYIDGDWSWLEQEALSRLAEEGRLSAYKHTGFWHPMDTLRDKVKLEELWATGNAPWAK